MGLLAAAALLLLVPLHGGRYLPPEDAPSAVAPPDRVVFEPGLGPPIVFDPERWEWWFEFHKETVLDLHRRRAALPGFVPVTEADRGRVRLKLLDALSAHPRDVRAAAAVALGRLGGPAVVSHLERASGDRDLFVRTQAVLALGLSGADRAAGPLRAIFFDDARSDEERTYAAAALALLDTAPALETLSQALHPKRLRARPPMLRVGIVYAAGVAGAPSLGPPLRALLESPLFRSNASMRALAAVALGRSADPDSLSVVLELLNDADSRVRRSAAMALQGLAGALDSPTVAKLIHHQRSENDTGTRMQLLVALGLSHDAAARAWLRTVLTRRSSGLRPWAALALGLDGSPANIAPLLRALEDERDGSLRAAIVTALGLLGATDAAGPLRALLLTERDPLLLAYTIQALGLIGITERDLGARLEELATDSHDAAVIPAATVALGLLGERQRLDHLADIVASRGSSTDRAALLYGLGLAGDRGTLDRLLAGISPEPSGQPGTDPARPRLPHAYVRAYLLGAIGEICDRRPLSPMARLSLQVEPNHDVGFLFELVRAL